MASTIPEESPAVYPTNIQGPDDGDDLDAASVLGSIAVGLRGLTNRTKYNSEKTFDVRSLLGFSGAPSTNVRLVFPPVYGAIDNAMGGTRWAIATAGTVPYALQYDVTDQTYLHIPLPGLPQRWWIDGFGVQVTGGSGHSGLPGSMPFLRLQQNDLGGSETLSWVQTDTSGSLGAYETLHNIERYNVSSDVKPQIGSGQQYHLELGGESGANALANKLICVSAWLRLKAEEPA